MTHIYTCIQIYYTVLLAMEMTININFIALLYTGSDGAVTKSLAGRFFKGM